VPQRRMLPVTSVIACIVLSTAGCTPDGGQDSPRPECWVTYAERWQNSWGAPPGGRHRHPQGTVSAPKYINNLVH